MVGHSESFFFALQPPASARDEIISAIDHLARVQGLGGKPLEDLLHITLCEMGVPKRLREPPLVALANAGGLIRYRPFDVVLDRVIGFRGGVAGHPNVLLCDSASSDVVSALHAALVEAQYRHGLQCHAASPRTLR